ncbi:hypothetical protein D9V41_08065 [Aeromicrobium phragmitis]|uniref:Haemin-degrading HemS/ChuX domain-containing protein n=1 Tax=Aeromicrobium phragmitis TaxID=2478914 RepID=A0A3L8PKE8_9ACTN|nr:hypothetical protein [Aeromicrobium phragmitis]RLV55855.1 hypothetical protein D9V41_08065 [Aeromicrobium phragmitis]
MIVEPAPAERWSDDLALLGSVLSGLGGTAVAATATDSSAVSATGSYGRLGGLGAPWPRQAADELTVRLCPASLDAFATDADGSMVRILNQDGDVVHRVVCSRGQGTGSTVRAGTTLRSLPWARERDPQSAARQLMSLDAQGHLDTLVADGGALRSAALDLLRGTHLVTPIAPALALHALDHLHRDRIPVSLAVPASGCLLAIHGVVEELRGGASMTFARLGNGTVRVDPAAITEAWVVRPENGAALVEFYDRTRRCSIAIGQPLRRDPVATARWEHLTAMLSIS